MLIEAWSIVVSSMVPGVLSLSTWTWPDCGTYTSVRRVTLTRTNTNNLPSGFKAALEVFLVELLDQVRW